MRKKKLKNKMIFKKSDYRLVMQLYYLNNADMKKEARLPTNDLRRQVVRKKTVERSTFYINSVKKAFLRIAALW
jgi:hypothetical protein